MSDRNPPIRLSRLSVPPLRIRTRLQRLARAWRYVTGRLTEDDAQDIFLECESIAGWRPLVTLCVNDILEEAHTRFHDHPALPELAATACAHVARKWQSGGDQLDQAQAWAVDLMEEWAAEMCIELKRHTLHRSTNR